MATILDKELKRRISVDGNDYTVVIDPEGVRLIGKGRRKPEVNLHWRDLVSGDAAMATALNASPSTTRQATPQQATGKLTEDAKKPTTKKR